MQQDATPMTVKNWLITFLVLAIPFVNIILFGHLVTQAM